MARKPPESHAKSKVAKAMHTERMAGATPAPKKHEGILDLTPDMEVKYRGGKWKPAGGGKKESNWAKWREKQGKGKKAA